MECEWNLPKPEEMLEIPLRTWDAIPDSYKGYWTEEIADDQDIMIPDIEMFVNGTPVDMDWYTEDEEHLFT